MVVALLVTGRSAAGPFGNRQGDQFEIADSAPHDFRKTIDPNAVSCALQGVGHWGPMFGAHGTPIHWWYVLQNLDLTAKCLATPCENVVSWCCFTRWLHVF